MYLLLMLVFLNVILKANESLLLSLSLLVLTLEHGHRTIRLRRTTWSVGSWPWVIFHGFLCLVVHVPHQVPNISLPHSLSMFCVGIILQNVEVGSPQSHCSGCFVQRSRPVYQSAQQLLSPLLQA